MYRTAVLLSGGVDSSVALHRLLGERGTEGEGPHQVTAFYLKIWLEDELAFLGDCPWDDDLGQARAVCDAAGVPLEVVSLQRQYHERIVAWALDELRAGRTPSPDVLCNRRIKFGAFCELLDASDGPRFDFVASGHYARIETVGGETAADGRWRLLRGVDPVKDQTYFLFRLDQDQLRRTLFPLGVSTKDEVRAEARRLGLPNRARKDSQGLCFLGNIPFDGFVEAHLGRRPGPIRRVADGVTVGEHRGHWFHTVGQRKGLGLHGGPWYVVAKDVASDTVWICHRDELAQRSRDQFHLASPHWIAGDGGPGDLAADGARVQVKVRHGPRLAGARIEPVDSSGAFRVTLEEPDPGLAPGQYAVLYRGDECLGGGVIEWPAAPVDNRFARAEDV